MKRIILYFMICLASLGTVLAQVQPSNPRPRILVSTDIGGTDSDDNQSMLHLLMYSDLFKLEGLVSSPSFGNGSKEEILRMIDIYEQDYPILKKSYPGLYRPNDLRKICKQGRRGLAPLAGFEKATEGSQWIIECAKQKSDQPLWILVWGSLEDVAQALHDAPEIAPNIRIYYIGGPNKKWGVNSYAYIATNFPNLWFIENNATYRGFISDPKNTDYYHMGFYDKVMKGAGNIGKNFKRYYNGTVHMGDTPSVLYLMKGTQDDPEKDSWGGSFEKTNRSSRRILNLDHSKHHIIPVYSVAELNFTGPKTDLPKGTPCFTLRISKQNWKGYYMGNGRYTIRYSPKWPDKLDYTITSSIAGFTPIQGVLTVSEQWPGEKSKTDYHLGNHWYTDKSNDAFFEGKCQGFKTQEKYRNDVLDDWADRLKVLKQASQIKE